MREAEQPLYNQGRIAKRIFEKVTDFQPRPIVKATGAPTTFAANLPDIQGLLSQKQARVAVILAGRDSREAHSGPAYLRQPDTINEAIEFLSIDESSRLGCVILRVDAPAPSFVSMVKLYAYY